MIKEIPFLTFEVEGRVAYGGDQEWYHTKWAKMAGCGAVLASNLYCFYANRLDISLSNYKVIMDEMFDLNTPGTMGFPYYYKFSHNFVAYMKDKGHVLTPVYHKHTISVEDGFDFVKAVIDAGLPIGMLILTHRKKEIEEETWHWMCITGYEEAGEKQEVIISSCGEKVTMDSYVLFDQHPMNVVRMMTFADEEHKDALEARLGLIASEKKGR